MTTPPIDWREQYRVQKRCEAARHPDALWMRVVHQQGTHLQYFCETCERAVTHELYVFDGKPKVSVSEDELRRALGIDADTLPVRRRDVRYQICYLCNTTTLCEWHHVAPQAIYGADADRYPIVPLCDACHDAETRTFTDRLEAYVAKRIERYLAKRGGSAA